MFRIRHRQVHRSASCLVAALILAAPMRLAPAAPFTWDGGGSGSNIGDWSAKQNWGNSGPPGSADTAIFTSVVGSSSTPTIPVAGSSINTITFNPGAAAFNISGSGRTLTINGGGINDNASNTETFSVSTVTLGAAQTWTVASGGSLSLTGTTLALGTSHALIVTGSGNTSVSNQITGSTGSTLTKSGTGTLTLSGTTNNYTAGTTISAGTLRYTNATGSATGIGSVTFNNGSGTSAILASGAGTTGAITGLVTTNNTSSTLTPGGVGTVGKMTLSGGLNASSGALFNFDIATKTTSDLISLNAGIFTGPTAANSGLLNISFNGLTGAQAGVTYQLFTYGSQVNVDAGDFAVVNSAGFSGATFTVTGTEVDVIFTTVPEPSTWVAAGLSLLAIAYSQRKRPRNRARLTL